MSLSGLIARRGSTVTVYHGLDTRSTGGESVRTYPTTTSGVGMLLEDLSDELVRRVFGQQTKATLRALVTDRSVVLNDGDNVVVTKGPHLGQQFAIAKQLTNDAGASPHRELALAVTTETLA